MLKSFPKPKITLKPLFQKQKTPAQSVRSEFSSIVPAESRIPFFLYSGLNPDYYPLPVFVSAMYGGLTARFRSLLFFVSAIYGGLAAAFVLSSSLYPPYMEDWQQSSPPLISYDSFVIRNF